MEKTLVAAAIFIGVLWSVDDKFASGRYFTAIIQIFRSVIVHWAAN